MGSCAWLDQGYSMVKLGRGARKFTGDAARDHYWAQPAIQAIREGQQTLPPEQKEWDIDDALSGTREDYVAAAEASAGVTYAVVFDGEWLQF